MTRIGRIYTDFCNYSPYLMLDPIVFKASLELQQRTFWSQKLALDNSLVPKLQLGNSVLEAPASRLAKLELRVPGSQAGAWEPAETAGAFLPKKNDVFYLALGDAIRLAFEIVGVETTSNIPPYTQRYVCNRRPDLFITLP